MTRNQKHLRPVRVDLRLEIRPEIDLEELMYYIVDAIEVMGGSRHPDDTLFYGVSTKRVEIIARGEREGALIKKPREIEPWGGEDDTYE